MQSQLRVWQHAHHCHLRAHRIVPSRSSCLLVTKAEMGRPRTWTGLTYPSMRKSPSAVNIVVSPCKATSRCKTVWVDASTLACIGPCNGLVADQVSDHGAVFRGERARKPCRDTRSNERADSSYLLGGLQECGIQHQMGVSASHADKMDRAAIPSWPLKVQSAMAPLQQ